MDGLKSELLDAAIVRSVVEQATLAIIITGPVADDNPIIFVNRGFEQLTQYSRASAMGRNCRFLQGKDTRPEDVERLRKGIAKGEDVTARILNYKADGTPFTNEVMISPVKNDKGEITAFFGLQRELSQEESQAEEDAERTSSMPADMMLRELQHRVKNHLSMIVSLIRLHARREITRASFQALSHRIEALAMLYEEMLRPHEGKGDDTVAAGAYLSRVASVIAGIGGRPSIRLNLDFDEISLPVDPAGRLGLLMTELLTNTFEHAFQGRDIGSVSVRLENIDGGRKVRLTVEDDGIGLPEGSNWPYESSSVEAHRSRAETETGKLDTTGERGTAGLGGSIVLGLTEVLQAEFDVQSGAWGTRITMTLDPADCE